MSKLGFYGGVGKVTGANFKLDVGNTSFLVDCGLIQGSRFQEDENKEPFQYDPSKIHALFVTHAHADHIGRIPKLVKDGFQGVIYSTPPTKDLAAVMLRDAYKVMLFEEEKYGIDRLYEEEDIAATLALWKTEDYGKQLEMPGGVTVSFKDAGHILGSAFVCFEHDGKKVAFSGDIGNVPQPLLPAPDVPKDYDYLVMESVYGDRLHEEVETRTALLQHYIEKVVQQNGTLIIPAFSLERTQGMLFEINNMVERGLIDPIPTYLDSPLAISVTDIYKKHINYLKPEIQKQIKAGDDIFDFPKLSFTRTVSASRDIMKEKGAKIIIAGSGMSHGGRILQHEINYLEDKKTILLLVGYQAVGSLGRKLYDGAKKVRINDVDVKVKAEVAKIRGYSGHADRDQLLDFVEQGGEKAKEVFVTMGEEKSSLFLVQRLRDYLGVNAVAPSPGEEVEIDF